MYTYSDIINHNKICLYEKDNIPFYNPEYNQMPTIEAYLVKDSNKAIVIYPGGGYFTVSEENEGRRIAKEYNNYGFSCFVITYRVRPYDGKSILLDAQKGFVYAKKILKENGQENSKMAICGFSAGAHLGMLVCEQEKTWDDPDNYFNEEIDPCACIMCYPVCTFENGVYPPMPRTFLGKDRDNPELLHKYSFSYNIEKMPPTFIFYTVNDEHVHPIDNSLALAKFMDENGKDYELFKSDDGSHGIGLGLEYPIFSTWHKKSVEFLNKKMK